MKLNPKIIAISSILIFISFDVSARCIYDNTKLRLSATNPEFAKEPTWSTVKKDIYMDVLLPYYEERRIKDSFEAANKYILRNIQYDIDEFPNSKWFPILKKVIEECIERDGKI